MKDFLFMIIKVFIIKNYNMKTDISNELNLIFVHKVGYNSKKNELSFDFIFSKDETNVDFELWNWDLLPAYNNALPPTEDFVDAIITLKTSKFNLFCLNESPERPYTHGYHTIQALAYEIPIENEDNDGYAQYENLMEDHEDLPLLVFHYGTTLASIKEKLYTRNIVLKNNEFVDVSTLKL